jgi:hypothetical protein
MTIRAVAELDPAVMRLLTEIRDRLPAPAPSLDEVSTPGGIRRIAQSQALYAVICTLDGWIRGARENHEDNGHRGEPMGEECWRQFAPSDIRSMVNDVARELGISFLQLGLAEEDNPERAEEVRES